MKKFYLFIITFYTFLSVKSQLAPAPQPLEDFKVIDTAKYEVRYSFKFKNHHTDKEYLEDIRVVQIGNLVVKDYSDIIFHFDSLATVNFKKGLPTTSNTKPTYPCEIFNYTKTQETKMKYRLVLNGGVLCYDDIYPTFNWNFSQDNPINIMGFSCGKATVWFAGREYSVWYTTDIPLPYGPYKFHGLPGLILKVEENTGMYLWEAFGIVKSSTPIKVYTYEKELKCDRQSAQKTIGKMKRKPLSFLTSAGSKVMVARGDGSFGAHAGNEKEALYEPIEISSSEDKIRYINKTVETITLDSVPDINILLEIRILNKLVYITYESKGGFGQRHVKRYRYDRQKGMMKYEKEYFKNDNGTYQLFAPVLFQDEKDSLFVYERDYPSVYSVSPDGMAHATGNHLITDYTKTPYPMVLEARQAFFKFHDEYLFIGREPKNGAQALFLSRNSKDSIVVDEVSKIIYRKELPSWTVNFGEAVSNIPRNIIAYAYQLYPAVQFLDLKNNKVTATVLPNANTGDIITEGANIWEHNPVHFRDIASNDKYLYALYWGKNFETVQKERKTSKGTSKIVKYAWDGRIMAIYTVDRCLESLGVTDDDIIIGFDGKDFCVIR